jgi:carbonic anhydrase/acetyltransferase-like protein (isoleucine patch superfamily)
MTIYALGDDRPRISPLAYVHPAATVIGRVTIGPGSSVWPQAVLRGDLNDIVVGAGTNIQDGSVVHANERHATRIGDGCVVGHLVHLEGCDIGDGALVGSGAVVLPGAVVGAGAMVGAAALVTGRFVVPPRTLALGAPASLRGAVPNPEHILINVERYRALARRHREGLVPIPAEGPVDG